MFKKPEDVRMTKEASESYGQKINERSAKYENVELASEEVPEQSVGKIKKLSEEEIKKRVGKQNYENVKDDKSFGSINS